MTAVFVADTHALVFHLNDDPRLGALARVAFKDAEAGRATIVVPVIVLAEIAWLTERGRVALDPADVIGALRAHPAYEVAPLDADRIVAFLAMRSVPEMHDRIIACEAKLRGATLITRDQALTSSGVVPVVW